MQELYFMQQIGTLLLQISGFLFALLALWIIAMAGAELFRDRINAGIKKNKRESETLEGKLLEEERRKKELEKNRDDIRYENKKCEIYTPASENKGKQLQKDAWVAADQEEVGPWEEITSPPLSTENKVEDA